jgi:hypothetical protein
VSLVLNSNVSSLQVQVDVKSVVPVKVTDYHLTVLY